MTKKSLKQHHKTTHIMVRKNALYKTHTALQSYTSYSETPKHTGFRTK